MELIAIVLSLVAIALVILVMVNQSGDGDANPITTAVQATTAVPTTGAEFVLIRDPGGNESDAPASASALLSAAW